MLPKLLQCADFFSRRILSRVPPRDAGQQVPFRRLAAKNRVTRDQILLANSTDEIRDILDLNGLHDYACNQLSTSAAPCSDFQDLRVA